MCCGPLVEFSSSVGQVVGVKVKKVTLAVLSTYKGKAPSCSTANAFRTARIVISTRITNGLLGLSVRRKGQLRAKRRVNLISALRLCLGGLRLRTGVGSIRDRHPSLTGRVTTAGRRVTATRQRGGEIRGLLATKTTGRGRLSS